MYQVKCRISTGWGQIQLYGSLAGVSLYHGLVRSNGEKGFDSSPGINCWCTAKNFRETFLLVLALCGAFGARPGVRSTWPNLISLPNDLMTFYHPILCKRRSKENIISQPNLVKQALWQGLCHPHGENRNLLLLLLSNRRKERYCQLPPRLLELKRKILVTQFPHFWSSQMWQIGNSATLVWKISWQYLSSGQSSIYQKDHLTILRHHISERSKDTNLAWASHLFVWKINWQYFGSG